MHLLVDRKQPHSYILFLEHLFYEHLAPRSSTEEANKTTRGYRKERPEELRVMFAAK